MPEPLKVKWNETRLRTFKDWLNAELLNTFSDRAPLEAKWIDLMTQWRSSLPKGEASWPWPGASNIEFPITPIHCDPVYSDFMQSLHTPEDYWSPIAKRPDRVAHANSLREFLTSLDKNMLRMRSVNERAVLNQVVLGTAIYKAHTKLRARPKHRRAGDTFEKSILRSVVPRIEHVPLQHFYLPANSWNVDPDAPIGAAAWVAQKFYLTRGELMARPYPQDFKDKVSKWVVDSIRDPVDEAASEADNYTSWRTERAELFEVWTRYDADGDDFEEDLLTVVHIPSMEISDTFYADTVLTHGKRPFHATIYLPGFGFYGQGIAEIDEWAQVTLTTLANQMINNVVLVNSRMFSAPQGSSLIPGEPIWPGRVITTPPGDFVREVKLGDIYPSLPALMQFIMQIAEMRTAVPELRQGNISGLPSRTPATTILSVLREGSKRFDMILSHTRDRHSEMGLHTLQNVAQLYADSPELWSATCVDWLGEEDARRVIEVLTEGPSALEDSFGIAVSATSALVNKEVEKQAFVGMMQTLIPMYQQLVQTAGLVMQAPPGTPIFETAAASYRAGVQLITRMLEKFDVQNPGEYIDQLTAVADQLSPQEEQPQQGAQQMLPPPYGASGVFPPGPPSPGLDVSSIFGL